MSGIFIKILNMSISAGFVALVIVLIRLLIKKAPKKYAYMLWAVVFFRFAVPITIQLPVSLVPVAPQTIPQDIVFSANPSIESGISSVDHAMNAALSKTPALMNRGNSANPIQDVLGIASIVWLAGIFALLLSTLIGYLRLRKKVSSAIRVKDNIFETDLIKSPFILGLIRPKIYIPVGIVAEEFEYIVRHELTHIMRRDNIIKPLVFLAATIHWFNPLAWVSFVLISRDMELSADEYVIRHSDTDIRSEYSNSLFALSVKKSGLVNLLAFGETGVSVRIKNVLKYKKPMLWVSTAAIVVVIAVSVLLSGSAASNNINAEPEPDYILTVYVDENYSEMDAMALRRLIESVENVDSAIFVSRQQAFEEFMSTVKDEPRFSIVDEGFFRHKYIVSLKDITMDEQTISGLRDIQGVYEITVCVNMKSADSAAISGSELYNEQHMAALIREIILKSDNIQECVLSLRLSDDSSYLITTSSSGPAANVVITTKNGDMLSESEIQAIAEIIRTVIPDMESENIDISDSNLNFYQLDSDGNLVEVFASNQINMDMDKWQSFLGGFTTGSSTVTSEQATPSNIAESAIP